jgi:DNA-binding NtrC family response regulator
MPGQAAGRARVLVVEDEVIIALELCMILAGLGHEVVGIALSGPQALRLAEQARPDLALVDVRLQGGADGVAVARELHGRLGVPPVFVTANPAACRPWISATMVPIAATIPAARMAPPTMPDPLDAAQPW